MKKFTFLFLAAAMAGAQALTVPTELVWALDAGMQTAPTPVLRFYLPNGVQRGTVTPAGAGAARGFCFDSSGFLYLCRGDEVRKLSPSGTDLGQVFTAPAGFTAAQDVFVRSTGASPLVAVAFGASTSGSGIAIYSSLNGGAPTRVITSGSLAQPRRLIMRQDGADNFLFVLSRDNNLLMRADLSLANPTLTTYFDLSASMIGPIGLAWDAARERFLVDSDFGQTNLIGTVPANPMPSFVAAFAYPPSSAAGLRAPAGMTFDRYRRLYIAGRNMNGGTAGVYVFDANQSVSQPVFLTRFPAAGSPAPVNIVDVEVQPTDMAICAPLEGTIGVMNNFEANRFLVSSQFYAGYPYVAAISLNWPTRCVPDLAPGLYVPTLQLPSPDIRGLPLGDDIFFRSSAGVVNPIDVPPLGGPTLLPFFSFSGFAGTLNAGGLGEFSITPNLPVSLEGTPFSVAFVTLDPLLAAGIGYISQPVCVTLRPAGTVVTLCP
jgi:hypothetical protein